MGSAWRHVGGGSSFGCSELPCDDDYEQDGTGRRVRFLCTPEAHFNLMPPEILDMDEFIRAIAGRQDIRAQIKVVP